MRLLDETSETATRTTPWRNNFDLIGQRES